MKGDLGDTRPPTLHRTTVWQRNLPAARRAARIAKATAHNRAKRAHAASFGHCVCGGALVPNRAACAECLADASAASSALKANGPKALRPCGCGSRGMHRASCPERAVWEAAKAG